MNEKELSRLIRQDQRETIWRPFLTAISRYRLLAPGDVVASCVSGGKDSFLLSLLLSVLARHSDFPFTVKTLVLDPGYSRPELEKITLVSARLGLEPIIKPVNLFSAVREKTRPGASPCFLCARMRRGALYEASSALGASMIALGHHLDDVMETTYLSVMYQASFQAMVPKARARHYPLTLIRPLYLIRERDIRAFWEKAGFTPDDFLTEACPLKEMRPTGGKREEAKQVLSMLERLNPKLAPNFLAALSRVNDETVLGIKEQGVRLDFNALFERGDHHE